MVHRLGRIPRAGCQVLPAGIPPLGSPRLRSEQHALLLRRLHRPGPLPQHSALLPRHCLRRRPGRHGLRGLPLLHVGRHRLPRGPRHVQVGVSSPLRHGGKRGGAKRGYEGDHGLEFAWGGRRTKHRWQYRDEVPVFAGYKDLPPAAYRPSVEIVRVKEALAWDRRVVPVTRPGSWTGDPWLGDKTDEGWDAIELSKLPVAAGGDVARR